MIRKLSRRLRHKARLSLCLPRLNYTSKRGKRREKREARRKEEKQEERKERRKRKACPLRFLDEIWTISFF